MIKFILIFILGALINRIRGGWLTDIFSKNEKAKKILSKVGLWKVDRKRQNGGVPYVKLFSDIAFGLCFGYVLHCNFFGYVILGLSHCLGRSFGWGDYIGGLKDKKVYENPDEVKLIDDLILSKKDNWKLRNTWALNIRGLIWSASIGLGLVFCSFFNNEIPFLGSLAFFVGLPMGYIYSFAFDICERHSLPKFFQTAKLLTDLKSRGNGWAVGELIFGAYLWSTLFLILWN